MDSPSPYGLSAPGAVDHRLSLHHGALLGRNCAALAPQRCLALCTAAESNIGYRAEAALCPPAAPQSNAAAARFPGFFHCAYPRLSAVVHHGLTPDHGADALLPLTRLEPTKPQALAIRSHSDSR